MKAFPSSVSPPPPLSHPPPPPYPPPPLHPLHTTIVIEDRIDFEDQYHYLSDFEVVEFCRATPSFAGSIYGNQLVRISEHLAVKFGIGVERQEAKNQNYAHRYVDPDILYVPRVFRFFRASISGSRNGFILMEFVQGVSLDSLNVLDDPNLAKRAIMATQHLATIPIPTGQGPGPVGGGSAQGYLWSDGGTGITFQSITGMENWINTRLSVLKLPAISLKQQPLCMRHMDLVRRNICLLQNSSICFMDWAFSGFYPEMFEIHTFKYLKSIDGVWFKQLLGFSPKPTTKDEEIMCNLGIPAIINTRYS
jgi:hypothetical protein